MSQAHSQTKQTSAQNTGGTLAGSSAQVVGGSSNLVNTGTYTEVTTTNSRSHNNSNNQTTTIGDATISGENNIISYSTGVTAEDAFAFLERVGNQFSLSPSGSVSTPGTGGGGGVTIVNSPPVSTVKAMELASVAKKYAVWIAVAVVAVGLWFFSRKKKTA